MWSQFAPYHLDRCEAAGACFKDKAEVLGIEVASGSRVYAWEPSGPIAAAHKVTLFPGAMYEDVPVWRRFAALLKVARRCDIVFFGIGYHEVHIVLLALILRLSGTRVIMMTDSKFDDQRRRIPLEMLKSLLLSVFQGALVAGHRQAGYMRFLGFRRRPVKLGYDCISIERVSQLVRDEAGPLPAWSERPFLCVGRMVSKKNHLVLIEAFARYVRETGDAARRLVLVGSGPLEGAVRERAQDLGVVDRLDMAGFLQAPDVAARMGQALALILISTEEQWGLVINEAVAAKLPVIASSQVGACDLLVENLVNGYVVNDHDVEAIARAMICMGQDEKAWSIMREGTTKFAAKGDVEFFAHSVKEMTFT